MTNLLASYSAGEIIIFIFMLAVAAKELIELIKYFSKEKNNLVQNEVIKAEQDKGINQVIKKIDDIENRIILLTESDKDDIKSWIVEKRNYYKKHPDEKIDDYTMDTIEKRYRHYVDEGGNSFIEEVVAELKEIAKKQ